MTVPPIREPLEPGAPHPEPEWTFQRGGQVFGPVPESRLRDLLFEGVLDAATPVAEEGGRYRPIAEVSRFLVDLRKAEAHLRVEREVTDSRRLAARRRRFRGAAAAGAALLLLAGGLGGAAWLARARPWQKRSALLADFGQGIAISVPARIGAAAPRPPTGLGEVAVPADAPRAARAPRARAAPEASRRPQGDLVLAQWDAADIQAVVAREQRTLAPCLREEAARSRDFAGEIPVEFAVGNDGRVAALWVDEPRFRDGPLHECLLRTLRSWRFKPFPGQQPVVSLAFRVGAP